MLNTNIKVLFISTLCGLLFLSSSIANDNKKKVAVETSRVWLALVDQEKYAESWRTAAESIRNAISSEQWEQMLRAARKPLGKVVKRNLKSKTYKTTLPGAPDGEYVVIHYETSFTNKKSAIETVTPMLEKDGKWRVSGYYIK